MRTATDRPEVGLRTLLRQPAIRHHATEPPPTLPPYTGSALDPSRRWRWKGSVVQRELQQAFDDVLALSLDELVIRDPARSCAPPTAERWRLPRGDIEALWRWGVPIFAPPEEGLVQLVGAVQEEADPALVERGQTAYRLGRYWLRTIGAAQDSGIVIGIPDAVNRDVSFINGSVAAFVEVAWRWYGVAPFLFGMEEDQAQLDANLYRFSEYVHALDPITATDDRFRWWDDLIEDW